MLSNSSVGNASTKGRTSGEGTGSSNVVEAANPTLDHLRTFLHLTTQAPLETVCRASLHVLAHVPAARQAVLEYLSTFYKVATFLHLRYNLNVKNSQYGGGGPSPADLITEANNLIQINMAIEMIESALDEMLTNAASSNELWSIELTHWLADMIGDIVANTASTCADSIPGLSAEEIASFKSPTINDGLELWSKQSKPAQSILQLIHKSFKSAKNETIRSKILDILLEICGKYPKKYDWVLAYFSCLNTELMLKKLLALELKEFSQPSSLPSTLSPPQKPPQPQTQSQIVRSINVISFYAKSYPKVTCEQIVAVLSDTTIQETIGNSKESNEEIIINRIMFVLRLATQSPPLLIVLLEQVLDPTSPYHDTLVRALKSIVNTDVASHRAALFACLNQINNSIGVFEIILNMLDALSLRNRPFNEFLPKICQYSILYLDELIASIYFTQSNPIETASDSIGFLRSLNHMDGHSLEALQNSMFRCLKIITTTKRDDNNTLVVDDEKRKKLLVQTTLSDELELIYRLFVVMMINTNEFKAGAFMRRLLTLDETTMQRAILNNDVNNKISLLVSLDEGILVKIRQEITPFHENCFADAVKSLVNYLTEIESDEEQLAALVRNMISVHDWDIQNRCSMNRNLSSIILERECFIGLMSQLKADKMYSLQIMELYNRIFKLDDDDLGPIKLTIPDLYRCANSFVDYFFELTTSINESNVLSRVNQINELTVLVENIICEHFRSWDDNSPFRNMLLRHLIERIFENLSANDKKNSSNDLVAAYDAFDENANLFNSNIQAINEEFLSNKSRLKAVRNSLIDEEFIKRSRTQIKNELKNLRNWALIDLFEAICSTKSGDLERRRKLKSELLGYLADLLVQHILVEQHFVDYQWSTIQLAIEVEESIESELESIKMFVERDMFVQNKVENSVDNQVIWLLLELVASDEQAFIKVGPIIRSLLASLIIQWEALPETPTRNIPKTLGITIRLLNTINRVSNFMPNPLCLIVDIVPILNSYETFISLMVIWRNLKRKMLLSISKPQISTITTESNKVSDLKHLRYIFQKNINKLAPLYAQFFKP